MRDETDRLTQTTNLFRGLEERPFDYDFFQALRRIECLFDGKPRIGRALRPADEPVRFAQEPSLAFAPATLASFQPSSAGAPSRLEVRFFGLLGPNGPLPLHLTEYARERLMHAGDRTFARFLDLLHHRFLALFYRAWSQAQLTASLDRPKEDRFSFYVGSLVGIGQARLRDRDQAPDFGKLFFSGLLSRHVRNRDGLAAVLSGFFRIPVRIMEFVGHWLTLPTTERTRLGVGDANNSLGRGVVLGSRVFDRQHKFRIRLGPLSLARYEAFLPGGDALAPLIAWVRHYLCFELEWDVLLVLERAEVPMCRLGTSHRLGWTTWLGKYPDGSDAEDLRLDAERVASRNGKMPGTLAIPVT